MFLDMNFQITLTAKHFVANVALVLPDSIMLLDKMRFVPRLIIKHLIAVSALERRLLVVHFLNMRL